MVGNGSGTTVKNAKNYDTVFGKLVIFKVGLKGKMGGTLTPVTDAQLGHACQGMVWSDDGKTASWCNARWSAISEVFRF